MNFGNQAGRSPTGSTGLFLFHCPLRGAHSKKASEPGLEALKHSNLTAELSALQ
jgi:hypothetical protein